MAKDLPYFKFIISEWATGNITLCTKQAQGLFVNLCVVYWSNGCALSYTNAKRRYNDCNTSVWKELISEKIIKVFDDQIKINFLDEQLSERKDLSKQNAENVQKRWKKDTSVLPSNNGRKVSVYNKEERREEKKREEKIDANTLLQINSFLQRKSENTMDVRYMVQQWMAEGATEILPQLKAMKAVYQNNRLVFPTKIETLTTSFMDSDWIKKLKELDPDHIAENIAKEKRNGKQRQPERDEIGTSEPGSLE